MEVATTERSSDAAFILNIVLPLLVIVKQTDHQLQ